MSRIKPLSDIRKSHIQDVMNHVKGDLEEASRILGVTTDELRRFLVGNDLYAVQEATRPPANFEEE